MNLSCPLNRSNKMTPPTEKQACAIRFALTGLAVATVIVLIVAAVWGLGRVLDLLSPVLWPLAIAAVVACLLSPVVDVFERKKVPRARAICWFCHGVCAGAGRAGQRDSAGGRGDGAARGKSSRILRAAANPHQRIHRATAGISPPLSCRVRNRPRRPPGRNPENPALASATDWLTGSLPAMGSWLLKQHVKGASGFGLLAGLALIPVYAFYFLLEQRGIESHWKDYLPLQDSRAKDELVFVLEAIRQYLVAFFRGQVLVALCDAVLYTIGFLIVGVNYAFLLGFAAVLLTMIPFLGAIVICVTALTLAFVQYGDWQHPALVLGVFAVVQSLEGLVISPKIMGGRVGLHPLAIIIAVMTGTTLLGGILGGILAIPLAAALRVILFRYVWKKNDA